MSDPGFYKRRRGILEHLESGKISLLDSGIHDYLCLKMNGVIGSGCNIPPGVVFTSSKAIRALSPKGISERAVRRSLANLERLGWIKCWKVRGKHGNYPVLVARSSVHDDEGNEYRVIGGETTDWHNPKLKLIDPSSTNSPRTVH
jgi:DNA-binding transcriptional regulator PaaX